MRLLPLLVLPPLLLSAQAAGDRAGSVQPIAIRDVTVVDVVHGQLTPGQTVLIRGNRIAALGPRERVAIPRDARAVDATGEYLIPGLWDLHVHALRNGRAAWMFPLFLAAGVLGIRDTGSPLDSLLRYRKATLGGEVLGPRVLGSGPLLDGAGGQWPDFTVAITSPEAGRRAVDSLASAGVDFIKVYDLLSRDAFEAIAEEAHLRRVPVIGHVPFAVSPLEASSAGMLSIEHVTVAPACIPALVQIMTAANATVTAQLGRDSIRAIWRNARLQAAAAYDEHACRQAGMVLARNGTRLVPTLSRERNWSGAYLASPAAGADPELRYVPRVVRAKWDRWRDSVVAMRTRADFVEEAGRYRVNVRIVRALRAAGVEVLPGTDTDGNDAYYYGVPGFALHTELETLVDDIGLTSADALRAATLGAATLVGAADSLGTVAVGKVADLVLLDANPLADVRNTRRVRAVMRDGHLVDRPSLDSMLAAAERTASAGATR